MQDLNLSQPDHLQFSFPDNVYMLIITVTISSNVIGALAVLFFTDHSVQL